MIDKLAENYGPCAQLFQQNVGFYGQQMAVAPMKTARERLADKAKNLRSHADQIDALLEALPAKMAPRAEAMLEQMIAKEIA